MGCPKGKMLEEALEQPEEALEQLSAIVLELGRSDSFATWAWESASFQGDPVGDQALVVEELGLVLPLDANSGYFQTGPTGSARKQAASAQQAPQWEGVSLKAADWGPPLA